MVNNGRWAGGRPHLTTMYSNSAIRHVRTSHPAHLEKGIRVVSADSSSCDSLGVDTVAAGSLTNSIHDTGARARRMWAFAIRNGWKGARPLRALLSSESAPLLGDHRPALSEETGEPHLGCDLLRGREVSACATLIGIGLIRGRVKQRKDRPRLDGLYRVLLDRHSVRRNSEARPSSTGCFCVAGIPGTREVNKTCHDTLPLTRRHAIFRCQSFWPAEKIEILQGGF